MENVKGIIDGFIARGLKEIRNDVATFGWDRATGKEKELKMDWTCCDGLGRCSTSATVYRENQMVPINDWWTK